MKADMLKIREALEASWDEKTSYLAVKQEGNPALGQCYPTSRVVQHFSLKQKSLRARSGTVKKSKLIFGMACELMGVCIILTCHGGSFQTVRQQGHLKYSIEMH
ncbi:hypothetical protein H7171_00605 [Candidatus Saccharibacteria bacterium]|nr:hypothetical protein [Candidatus Saccharibacteria bacterium]